MHDYLFDHPFIPKNDPFPIPRDNKNDIVLSNNPCPKHLRTLHSTCMHGHFHYMDKLFINHITTIDKANWCSQFLIVDLLWRTKHSQIKIRVGLPNSLKLPNGSRLMILKGPILIKTIGYKVMWLRICHTLDVWLWKIWKKVDWSTCIMY